MYFQHVSDKGVSSGDRYSKSAQPTLDNWLLLIDSHLTFTFELGPCSLCLSGGDCITGRSTIWNKSKGKTIESTLRKEHPHIFKLLQYALQILFRDKVKINFFMRQEQISLLGSFKDSMASSHVSNLVLKYM